MLNAMRKRVSSFFVTILMGLLIASFAIWGIGDVFRLGGGNAIATVGEARITAQDFAREFENEVRRWQQQLGGDFTATEARNLGMHQQVLARMVSRLSFDVASTELGLRASDEQVRDYIAENPAFRNSLGEFDKFLYEDVLRRIGFTPSTFEDASRDDLTREQLIRAVGDASHLPDGLARLIYKHRAEERVVDVATVRPASITGLPEPTEEELRTFYEANQQRFMAPEYRSLSYILVTAADLAGDIQVTEAEMQAYYDTHLNEFVTPERRVIEQIVLFDEAEAEAAYDALQNGEDFLSVANRVAGLSADDVKLGEKTERELAEDISNAAAARAFAVEVNTVTEPQQSAFGWHILRPTSVIPGVTTTLEQARPVVERRAREEAGIDQLFDVINAMEDELARGGTLIEAAAVADLPVVPIEAVDSEGLTPEGAPEPDLPDVPGFLREAFTLEPNTEPMIQDAGSSAYYVLSVTGVTPSTVRPFDEVRGEVRASWTADRRRTLASEKAQELATAALGQDLAGLVDADSANLQTDVRVLRDPAFGQAEISGSLRDIAFQTPPGSAAVADAADGNGFLVVRVKSRTPGDPAAAPEALRALDEQLVRLYANDVLGAYQGYLERQLGFTVNERLLEDTLAQLIDSQP